MIIFSQVWRDRSLVSKTSWTCSLDGMQYFATISAGELDAMDENILWLSTDHILGGQVPFQRPSVVDLADMVPPQPRPKNSSRKGGQKYRKLGCVMLTCENSCVFKSWKG